MARDPLVARRVEALVARHTNLGLRVAEGTRRELAFWMTATPLSSPAVAAIDEIWKERFWEYISVDNMTPRRSLWPGEDVSFLIEALQEVSRSNQSPSYAVEVLLASAKCVPLVSRPDGLRALLGAFASPGVPFIPSTALCGDDPSASRVRPGRALASRLLLESSPVDALSAIVSLCPTGIALKRPRPVSALSHFPSGCAHPRRVVDGTFVS